MAASLYFVVESVAVFMNKVLNTLAEETARDYLKSEWVKFKDILTDSQPTQMLSYAQALILTPPSPIVPVATFHLEEISTNGSNNQNYQPNHNNNNVSGSNSDQAKRDRIDSLPSCPQSLASFGSFSNIQGTPPPKGVQIQKQNYDNSKQPNQMYSTLGGCNSLLNLKNPSSNEKTNNLQPTTQLLSINSGATQSHTHFGSTNDKSSTKQNLNSHNALNISPNVTNNNSNKKTNLNVGFIPQESNIQKPSVNHLLLSTTATKPPNIQSNNKYSQQKSPISSASAQALKLKNNQTYQQQFSFASPNKTQPAPPVVKIASPNFNRPTAVASVHVKAQKSLQIDIKEHTFSSRQVNIHTNLKDRSTSASGRNLNTVGNVSSKNKGNYSKESPNQNEFNGSASFTNVASLEDSGILYSLQSQKLLNQPPATSIQTILQQPMNISQNILPGYGQMQPQQQQISQQQQQQQQQQYPSQQITQSTALHGSALEFSSTQGTNQNNMMKSTRQTPLISSTNVEDLHKVSASPPVNLVTSINAISQSTNNNNNKTLGKLPNYSINSQYSGLINSVNNGFSKQSKGGYYNGSISSSNASHNMLSSRNTTNNVNYKHNMTADHGFSQTLKNGIVSANIPAVNFSKTMGSNNISGGYLPVEKKTYAGQDADIRAQIQTEIIKTESVVFEKQSDIQNYKLIISPNELASEEKEQQFKRRISKRGTRKLSLEIIKPEDSDYFQQLEDEDQYAMNKGKRQILLNRFDQNLESSLEMQRNRKTNSPVNRRVGVEDITSVRDLGTWQTDTKKINPFKDLILRVNERISRFKLDSMTLELVAGKLTNIETRLNRTNKATPGEDEGGFQERAGVQRANLKRYSVFAKKDGQPADANQKKVEDTITKDEEITDKVGKSKFDGSSSNNKNRISEKKKKLIF